MQKNKFYITTSIAYTNAPPHLGFALELIQADVLARYNRFLKKEVYFLTGTDEHGIKIEKSAKKEKKNPKKFVDEISKQFLKLTKVLNISNDDFIRTTDKKRHIPTVIKVWQKLKEKGDIYKQKYKGFYCSGCEAFLTQKDLVNQKCPLHKTRPQLIEEENYFFRLSRYQKQLQSIIEKEKIKIIPRERKREVISFIKKGLKDISFSRPKKTLHWGIPVPGDPSQIIYVWCDALVNYLSAIGYKQEKESFFKFWPADIHLIGKDILRFHAIYWPAMLISLNLPLPKTILVHGFITVDGQKMSKSLGNVVDPFEIVKKYGPDALRYYLLREIPTTKDGDFSLSKFKKRYNDDLAKGLGNLVARVMGLKEKNSQQKKKAPQLNPELREVILKTKKGYHKYIQEYKFNEALKIVWDLIGLCDKYIEEKRLWEKTKKQQKEIAGLTKTLQEIASFLKPFLPSTSEKILNQLQTNKREILFPRI